MARRGRASRDTAAASRRATVLSDCIQPGVRVLFVGINPGIRSAEIGHHFAGYSNRFWKLLHESQLVPEPIGTEDDRRLPEWGYGITNLVRRATPGIGDLRPEEYAAGRRRLVAKIRRFGPAVVALVGVTLYRALFTGAGGAGGAGGGVLGLRPEKLAGADVFVLPNPSGRNANFTYREMLDAFRALEHYLDALPGAGDSSVPVGGRSHLRIRNESRKRPV